ncbi:hypothetical protein CC86DRAFT_420731 [Ophiobolus disseminans]|uniref:RING-type E3 ubiquitin transferase n=1 Tax=Ophiobolus disseminans TaxID=1469910 RepID=A0A6A6ZT88_9PLEO|nr:hypothetical protein CC86DRAFT_420731 [Ophiobolus disseminans]
MFRSFFSKLFTRSPISPASEAVVDPLENSCCICYHKYGGMGSEAESAVLLKCGHEFGAMCIDKWNETNPTCPMCRAKLDFDDKDDIYEQSDVALTHRFLEDVSHVEDFGQAEFDNEEPWFDIHKELAASDIPTFDEDIFITAYHDENIRESLSPIGPRHPSFEDKLFDMDPSDPFDELRSHHEQWMTECLKDEDTDDENCISYFDIFPN